MIPDTYQKAKAERTKLYERLDSAQRAIDVFPRHDNGVTPDTVKATPAWRSARTEIDDAFKAVQKFNVEFLKKYKKEYAAERRSRTAISS